MVLATLSWGWSRTRVELRDAASGRPWGEPLESDHDATALAVVTDAAGVERLAVGDKGGTVRIWDVENGVETDAARSGHHGGVHSMTPLPDGSLGVAAHDGSVHVWSLQADSTLPRTAHGPGSLDPRPKVELRTVVGPDGTSLTAFTYLSRYEWGDEPNFLQASAGLWDSSAALPSGPPITEPHGWDWGGVEFAGWCDTEGRVRLALVHVFGIMVYDVRDGSLHRPPWDLGKVESVEVFAGPEGTPWLAAGGKDGTVRLLDLLTGLPARPPLFGPTGSVETMTAFRDRDGRVKLATCHPDTVHVWDLTRTQDDTALPPTGHSGRVTILTPPPADRAPALVATYGEGDETVRLWDQATGRSAGEPIDVKDGWSSSISPEWIPLPEGGFGIAQARTGKGLRRWTAPTGHPAPWPPRTPLGGRRGRATSTATYTDHDGTHLLATVRTPFGKRSTVRLWNATTGQPLRRWGRPVRFRLPKDTHTITPFTAPDGSILLAALTGHGIQLWSGLTGTRTHVPATRPKAAHVHRPELLTAFPTNDGTVLLAAVSRAHHISIWNPWTGLVTEWDSSPTVHKLLTLPGSPARLASADQDGTLRIWEPLTGTLLGTMDTGAPLHDLATGPTGILFLAGTSGLTALDLEATTDRDEPGPATA
ncbi:WD40 repeat domain-containing protein [Streptomyces sp. TE33382]